jgi:segregation and condensation protein B
MAKKNNPDTKLLGQIESVLLVAEKPVSVKELSTVTGSMVSEVQKSLVGLIESYQGRGIKVIKKGEYYSLVTDPENSEVVARFLNEELRHDLSDASLETLSIVTYKQPITRIEIEEIRGASSDQLIRNLMVRGLISEVGRKETPGRPILYGTTMEFLQYFGLSSEEEIPKFDITDPKKADLNGELFESVDTLN